jgi:hypothetical protein
MAKDEQRPPTQAEIDQKIRIAKAAKQLAAYATFLRWSCNFKKDEILSHPKHRSVKLLSPMISGRFAFAIEDETLYLGVQPFEAVWFEFMPWSNAYISDRLYLAAESVECMEGKLTALGVGIFVDTSVKRTSMKQVKNVQCVVMEVEEGEIVSIGKLLGPAIPLGSGDVINALQEKADARRNTQDITRFF